jgi:hypothetical protein
VDSLASGDGGKCYAEWTRSLVQFGPEELDFSGAADSLTTLNLNFSPISTRPALPKSYLDTPINTHSLAKMRFNQKCLVFAGYLLQLH